MRKIDRLKREARDACEFRGHDMGKFFGDGTKYVIQSKCRRCGMQAWVDTNPPPNGIDIAGEAVALNCERED